ncbi:hypothetical protein ACS0TY_026752 [Phlomoides rotata]
MVQVLVCGADWVRQLHGIKKPIMTYEQEESIHVVGIFIPKLVRIRASQEVAQVRNTERVHTLMGCSGLGASSGWATSSLGALSSGRASAGSMEAGSCAGAGFWNQEEEHDQSFRIAHVQEEGSGRGAGWRSVTSSSRLRKALGCTSQSQVSAQGSPGPCSGRESFRSSNGFEQEDIQDLYTHVLRILVMLIPH